MTDGAAGPADRRRRGAVRLRRGGDPRTYRDLTTPAGLAWIATYADGIGANKDLVLPARPGHRRHRRADRPGRRRARRAASLVHVWTLRDENQFMAANFRIGTDPNAKGDLRAEALAFLDAGVDGMFSDNPDVVAGALGEWSERDAASRSVPRFTG